MVKLRGAIFDMDGTVVDVPYDWKQIKEELKTQGKPILSHLQSLAEPDKSAKWKILEKHENQATRKAVLKKGMKDFLRYLKERSLKTALVTNNSRKNVRYILEKFDLDFDIVLSREMGLWKPSGAPFSAVLKALKLSKEECCVIGDTFFDIEAAKDVGIRQVFILNEDRDKFVSTQARIFPTVQDLEKYIEPLL
ncbi:MAG: HAD-IA family hydrolase [Candidatus Aminicenantes bacterium]|nr:HAD-IA family hydrolase [Candidatus Aminicenantes bacterium]